MKAMKAKRPPAVMKAMKRKKAAAPSLTVVSPGLDFERSTTRGKCLPPTSGHIGSPENVLVQLAARCEGFSAEHFCACAIADGQTPLQFLRQCYRIG
jgi:hypothetical protein